MNLATLLSQAAATMGNRVAAGLSTNTDAFTYERLSSDATALASRIHECGAEYLVVCDESSPALLTALFGAARSGSVYAPLNYRLPDDELRSLATQLTPGLAVVSSPGARRLASVRGLTTVHRREVTAAGPDEADPCQRAPVNSPNSLNKAGDLPEVPDTAAVLLHTSGTTGPPKSAVLRHRHLLAYVIDTEEPASAGPDEAHLLATPPYHVASVATLLTQLHAGRRLVMLPRFDAEAWIDLAHREHITHAKLVPTMLERIVAALDQRGRGVSLPEIRSVAYGGGKSHPATVMRAMELMPNADFTHAYGLTEACSTVAVLGPEEHRLALNGDNRATAHLSSVGKPLPTLEVSVRDSDGSEVPYDNSGEIWVRGQRVSGEYHCIGSQLDTYGWFHTGDIGRFSHDGRLYLLGRSDDMIVRGGENTSPGEIEAVLLTHPSVTDAAAFGVSSREWGEEIAVAVVIARAPATNVTADELRELVRTRLRSSRMPSRVEFVNELPYNETGKLLRRVLRERFDQPISDNLPNG